MHLSIRLGVLTATVLFVCCRRESTGTSAPLVGCMNVFIDEECSDTCLLQPQIRSELNTLILRSVEAEFGPVLRSKEIREVKDETLVAAGLQVTVQNLLTALRRRGICYLIEPSIGHRREFAMVAYFVCDSCENGYAWYKHSVDLSTSPDLCSGQTAAGSPVFWAKLERVSDSIAACLSSEIRAAR